MLLLPASIAVAAPTFVGEPEDVLLASRAWAAAVTCTGREGSATPTVPLVRKTLALDYLGVARTDPTGVLWRIDLNTVEDRHREVVVHEVSHAWVSDGPVALVEGAAELLADCIVRGDPGLAPLQYDDGRSLDGLPDLRAWTRPGDDVPTELHAVRTDAYLGAARFLRTAADLLPERSLWSGPTLSWDTLRDDLRGAGARGEELLAALDGGVETQREALADDDRDGLTRLQERWRGTDDGRFDTDGDGWWDGAAPAVGAVVVPLDGSPVCAGGGVLRVGDDARGEALPVVVLEERPGGVALARLSDLPPAASTGGWWMTRAVGVHGACADGRRATVWAEDPALASLVPSVQAALGEALLQAERRFGPGPDRVAVALGGGPTRVEGAVVRLGADDLADPQHAARLAVAARRAWIDGVRDWTAVEALALAQRD